MSDSEYIPPRPEREEQAWREIGVTDFAPGIKWFLVIFFLLFMISVPLAQFIVSPESYQKLLGTPVVETAATGPRFVGRIAAISSGPDRDAVYRDFLMNLHVTAIQRVGEHGQTQDAVIVIEAMRNRIMLPAAFLKAGDEIEFSFKPWEEVAPRVGGLRSSELDDLSLLSLRRIWGEGVKRIGGDETAGATAAFAVWAGVGRELPSDARFPLFEGTQRAWNHGGNSFLDQFFAANTHVTQRIRLYETNLDDTCLPALLLRPHVQEWMIRLGAGNEKALVGLDGWVFYQPDVASLVASGFLEEETLRSRRRSGDSSTAAIQPDPRKAILDFQRQLAARGITLVVMPTALKPTIHPEKLSPRYNNYQEPIHNPSYHKFLQNLSTAGVIVYDPAPLLKKRMTQGVPQYLATDTHWRPEAMEAIAKELAGQLKPLLKSTASASGSFIKKTESVEQLGDIGTMLKLPEGQTVLAPEKVSIRRILNADGKPWEAKEEAELLLLGDSFTNIFSVEGMGWGGAAGLAEQLAFELGMPVDRISRNDAGAHATRELLREALERDPQRLRSTRVLVWQFAERELSLGDWKMIQLPDVSTPTAASSNSSADIAAAHSKSTPAPTSQPAKNTPTVTNAIQQMALIAKNAEAADKPAIIGKENWIFLTSELRSLTVGPFWGEHAAKVSKAKKDPDPLRAIVDLKENLDKLGIEFILMPVPPRAVVYADKLIDRVPVDENGHLLRVDPELQKFYEILRKRGVNVLDLTNDFLKARSEDAKLGPVCCEQDTHWSIRGIEIAASRIKDELKDKPWLKDLQKQSLSLIETDSFKFSGDLVDRVEGLKGATTQSRIARVSSNSKEFVAIAENPDSPIMILSDSHGLVFHSGGDMHAEGAGLSDKLAYELGSAIDLMARRGSGASVRVELARRFWGAPADATKKKVVIYCFAARAFTESESWKLVPLKKE